MHGEPIMIGLMIVVGVVSFIFGTAMAVETIWLDGRSEKREAELRADAMRG